MKKNIYIMLFIPYILSACYFQSQVTPTSKQLDTQLPLKPATLPTSTVFSAAPETQITASPTLPIIPTQTNTPIFTASPTIQPIFTVMPTELRQTTVDPTWTNPSDWNGFIFNSQNPYIKISLSNGNLELKAVRAHASGWSLTNTKVANFYLEATFKIGMCSGSDEYGLVFRAPDSTRGYLFGVSCDGGYALNKEIAGGLLVIEGIIGGKSPDILVDAGQVNLLGVKATGNQYSLYVNGKLLGEGTNDSFLGEGIFGAFIRSANIPGLTVMVQSMRFWTPP